MHFLRFYWFALIATAAIWIATGVFAGSAALLTVIILTVLEATFSADNAVVNSRILITLNRFWQNIFMTVGVLIAVFVVRFALPIFIVMLTAHLNFSDVLNLALHHPQEYSQELTKAEPFIAAFGGTFLIMIAFSYFIDYQKQTHWLSWLEKRLGKLGQFDGFTTFVMLLAATILYFSVGENQSAVLIASILAMTVHSGLRLVDVWLERLAKRSKKHRPKRGAAAFATFLYLEVLDATFSLDGVIGSFAITNSVLLIMAGLGAGAVWVRAVTAHLVRNKTLARYRYLENGAHWAICFLGLVLFAKLFGFTAPEWFVGSLGMIFIILAVASSKRRVVA